MIKLKQGFLLLFAAALLFPLWPVVAQARTVVQVGIYENNPGVFTDSQGVVQGFYIDLLEDTARREGWSLEYVFGVWAEGLQRLEDSKIDLLVAIAYSKERDKLFDFTKETALANWGQVYVLDPKIQSVLDLANKTVVGLENDIYTAAFESILQRFGVPHHFVLVTEYATALRHVAEGKADAGIVSRTFGLKNDALFPVQRSTIVCCPNEIRYATAAGRNSDLLQALDQNLKRLKEDKNSIYYQSMDRWFDRRQREVFPLWLQLVLMALCGLLLLVSGGNFLLSRQVRRRTREFQVEISRRQGREAVLQSSCQELQSRNADLRINKEQAEIDGRRKKALLAHVGHEGRVSLQIVMEGSQALLQGTTPEESRHLLHDVLKSARQLDLLLIKALQEVDLDSASEASVENNMPIVEHSGKDGVDMPRSNGFRNNELHHGAVEEESLHSRSEKNFPTVSR